MSKIEDLSLYLGGFINIDKNYIYLIILTIIVFLVAFIIKRISFSLLKIIKDNHKRFLYMRNFKIAISLIKWLVIFLIWEDHIASLITLISFISAAIALSLRELILNFFSGIYIKIKKPFEIEDRIQIEELKGDVVNMTSMNFEVLEIGEKSAGGQSTGIIISFPNSTVFKQPIKNYNKAFKYVWEEISVCLPIDSDIENAKKILLKIVNSNALIKSIPPKMKNQINDVGLHYRIYYNQYNPIIYTKVIDNHIELQIRFLMHPKKARYAESQVWNEILEAQKDKQIILAKE
ncbi:MAG: mechanosensitive ion channel [Bacilli bacterium]